MSPSIKYYTIIVYQMFLISGFLQICNNPRQPLSSAISFPLPDRFGTLPDKNVHRWIHGQTAPSRNFDVMRLLFYAAISNMRLCAFKYFCKFRIKLSEMFNSSSVNFTALSSANLIVYS